MSAKEEGEQDIINKSITVDFDRRITTKLLPLMFNPLHKLAHKKKKHSSHLQSKTELVESKPAE